MIASTSRGLHNHPSSRHGHAQGGLIRLLMATLTIAAAINTEAQDLHRDGLKVYQGPASVIEAFRYSPIVALPDRHRDSNISRFRISLISTPDFGRTVNDIIIEWGNSLYQRTLDRYIAGSNVSPTDLQKVWRNTVGLNGLWDSPVYAEFLAAVREANAKLPKHRHIRVLAGDPPIDWAKVRTREDWERYAQHRDESVLSVIECEVLAKHHKVLLIMGSGHMLRGVVKSGPGVVDLFEKAHPRTKIFVIGISPSITQELRSYPDNSIFFTQGTWLQKLASNPQGLLVYDGILTIHDGDDIRPPSTTYQDPVYAQELDRRWRIVRREAFNPDKLP